MFFLIRKIFYPKKQYLKNELLFKQFSKVETIKIT